MFNRREFLIRSAGMAGACLLGNELAQRIGQHQSEQGQPLLIDFENPDRVLFAFPGPAFQLSLDKSLVDDDPPRPTWREYFKLYEGFDEDYPALYCYPDLDSKISDEAQCDFTENHWDRNGSATAMAYDYLITIPLADRDPTGADPLGKLWFDDCPAPGNDSKIVSAYSLESLSCLQQRLLELGEEVAIVIG
mgnify:CR=1 FL=1